MQKLAPGGLSRSKGCDTGILGAKVLTNGQKSILPVMRFGKPFERDVFRFNQFSNFRETTFVRVNATLVSPYGIAPHVNES